MTPVSPNPLETAACEVPWDLIRQRGWKGECAVHACAPTYHKTPLIVFAVSLVPEAVPALLAGGADPSACGPQDRSVLSWALLRNPSLVPVLLAAGASLHTKGGAPPLFLAAQMAPEAIPALLAAGADLHARDAQNRTVLMLESCKGFAALLAAGADVHAVDRKGNTVLLTLLQHPPSSAELWPEYFARIDAALAAGARVDARNAEKETALMWAAATHEELVGKLLTAGADPASVDGEGLCALCWAARGGQSAAFARLLTAGADTEAWEKAFSTGSIERVVSNPSAFDRTKAHWEAWLLDGHVPDASSSPRVKLRL